MEGERTAPTTRAVAFLDAVAGALGGPLFTRELRVASRKGRTYLLRCLYVLGLAAAFLMVLGSAAYSMSTAFGMARAALFASVVAHVITWANFVIAQLIAVSALGSVMSDEARQRTLGTVLTTPLGAGRFVTGMLLGRLVQPLSIVALSFPCIAFLRVFGGIPWQLVGAGFCITVTTAFLAGALALCLSVCARRAASVSGVAGALMLLLHIGPGVVLIFAVSGTPAGLDSVLLLASPALVLETASSGMAPGAGWPGGPLVSLWPLHCALALGATALLLALAAAKFRASALRHVFPAPRRKDRAGNGGASAASLRPVRGNALVWKETVTVGRLPEKILTIALTVLALATLVMAPWLRNDLTCAIVLFVLFVLSAVAILGPTLQAAECITREKESRTWPVVLLLPFTAKELVKWKLRALLRKNAALWCAVLLAVAAMLVIRVRGRAIESGEAVLGFFLLVPHLASVAFVGLALGLWSSATEATSRKSRLLGLLRALFIPLVGHFLAAFTITLLRIWYGSYLPSSFAAGISWLLPLCVEIALGCFFLNRAAKHIRSVAG